ncbi:MAG: hypothetical protein WCF36_16050 [Candidatus Nanopelagicales bacterium]
MKRTMTAVVSGVALAAVIGVGVAAASESGPGSRMADALSDLVGKGTISQDQAEAVTEALEEARTAQRADRDAARAAQRDEMDTLLTDTLGMDLAAVREELAAGSTLREIAGDRADELAAGLLAHLDSRLTKAVADGRITAEQATATLDRAKAQADAWLAGDDSALGGRGLGGLLGARGMGGPDMSSPGMVGRGGGGRMGHGSGADDSAESGWRGATGSTATDATWTAWRV